MKALCILSEEESAWTRTIFQSGHALVPFLNKPLIEYYFDFFEMLGVEEVRISQDDGGDALSLRYGDSKEKDRQHHYDFKVSFAFHHSEDDLNTVLQKNGDFLTCHDRYSGKNSFAKREVLILRGFLFLHYDKRNRFLNANDLWQYLEKAFPTKLNGALLEQKSWGMFLYKRKTAEIHRCELKQTKIIDVRNYFELSNVLMNKEREKYVLPGYRETVQQKKSTNNDNDRCAGLQIIAGKKVAIAKNAEIIPPAILGNHSVLRKDVSIGSGCIVGEHSFIDRGTVLRDCIVLDGVYVGQNLFLNEVIISNKHLIKPLQNEVMELDDRLLLNAMPNRSNRSSNMALLAIVQRLLSFCLLPLWAVACVARYALRLKREKVGLIGNADRLAYVLICNQSRQQAESPLEKRRHFFSAMTTVFFRLSLDKFLLLNKVVDGTLWLAGSAPLPANTSGRNLKLKMKTYRAGVFTFSSANIRETSTRDNEELKTLRFINELYFSHHFSIAVVLATVVQSFIARLHRLNTEPWDETLAKQ